MHGLNRWLAAVVATLVGGVACANADTPIELRRTTDGIPHVRAHTWRGLGVGVGYAQAQDALCTLAEAFVTYEGRRAWFFGPEAKPARDSTFGRPTNLDLDFFFRAFADHTVVSRYRESQPAELDEMLAGYADGYNRWLREARGVAKPSPACAAAAWVREIGIDDLYRRLYAAQAAAGYAHFIPELVGARPATPGMTSRADESTLSARLRHRVGLQAGVGSNVLAFGQDATGEPGGVLFGNPHWYWGGPDRFYQMHLTLPGRLDVAGVAFLGVPVVMIGFNQHVAWSHTVSEARRFGFFDLTLDPSDATRVLIDGRSEPMAAHDVSVDVRDAAGERRETRTFYRTRFGPVVDLAAHNAAFGWGSRHAVAIRDVNADNFRVFSNFFRWNQATSLDEFIAIQREEAAVPWVNTVAIGSGDGRVWYGDVGAVPNVPDALRVACSTARTQQFAAADPLTPFLDGSRGECNWVVSETAPQPGAMPADRQPSLFRRDYVANMNDSHWLANVHQPLEGYPAVFGGERQALSLRGRMGHRLAQELVEADAGSAEALSRRVRQAVLSSRAYSAERFKDELLQQACEHPVVQWAGDAKGALPAEQVRVGTACRILRRWNNRADAHARGALLWESFWARLSGDGDDTLYRVGFSSDDPLHTPASPAVGDPGRPAQALAAAVVSQRVAGVPLSAALGEHRFVQHGQQRVPVFGGCPSDGYFTVACNDGAGDRLGPDALANSYLQVVSFGRDGVRAHTLLAHGQHEEALVGGRGWSPVVRYARKDWLKFPFDNAEIARDPGLTITLLRP